MNFKLIIIALVSFLAIQSTSSFEFSEYADLVNEVKNYPNEIMIGVVTSSNLLCGRCDQAIEPLTKFLDETKGMFRIHILDCEKERNGRFWNNLEKVCKDHQALPHITIFEQKSDDKNKQWPQDHIYNGAVDTHFMLQYLQNITFNTVKSLDTTREHRVFYDNKEHDYKLVYLTEDEDTPLLMKIISVQQRDTVKFVQVDSDNDSIKKKYPQLKKNKGLVFLSFNPGTSQWDQDYFNGKLDSHKEITQFIDNSITQSKLKVKETKSKYLEELNEVQTMKVSKFTKLKLDNDPFVLLHLHKKDEKPHSKYEQVREYYGAFFQTYDCPMGCSMCTDNVEEFIGDIEFPALLVYPQGQKDFKKFIQIKENESFEDINNKLLAYTNATEKALYHNDEKRNAKFFQDNLNQYNKQPVIWYYDSKDSKQKLFMHTISYMKRYVNNIRFASFADPDDDIRDSWLDLDRGLTDELPQLFAVVEVEQEEKIRTASMIEQEKSFFNLVKYLEGLVASHKQKQYKKVELKDVSSPYAWENDCLSGQTPCLIAMLTQYRKNKFDQEKEQYNKLKDLFPKKKLKWTYMDGFCREEILKSAKLTTTDVPTLIYLDHSKGKYLAMEEPWTEKNIEKFVSKLRKKGTVYKDIDDEFILGKKECKDFNDRLLKKYEAEKQQEREQKIAKERQNKKAYDNLPHDYDIDEGDDGLDQYGMKRDRYNQDHDDL